MENQNKEVRMVFDEIGFSNLCKSGFILQNIPDVGRTNIYITKADVKVLIKGEILTKEVSGNIFKFILADLGTENIREMIRRSPLYSEIYWEN